jgi:hypothetical protein
MKTQRFKWAVLGAAVVAFTLGNGGLTTALAGPLSQRTLAASWPATQSRLEPTTAVVSDGDVEFTMITDFNDEPAILFDFEESGLLRISYAGPASFLNLGGGIGSCLDHCAVFSDAEDSIADISGFSIVSVDGGINGFSQDDLSFTADSISLNLDNTGWPNTSPPTVALLQMQFVPEPATLSLLSFILFGLTCLRAKRTGDCRKRVT